jgi:hypothetical protein
LADAAGRPSVVVANDESALAPDPTDVDNVPVDGAGARDAEPPWLRPSGSASCGGGALSRATAGSAHTSVVIPRCGARRSDATAPTQRAPAPPACLPASLPPCEGPPARLPAAAPAPANLAARRRRRAAQHAPRGRRRPRRRRAPRADAAHRRQDVAALLLLLLLPRLASLQPTGYRHDSPPGSWHCRVC